MDADQGRRFDRDVAKRVRSETYFGQELVARPRRLALMNLYLHGVEPHITLGDSIYEPPSAERFDVILTNPPFGTKGANQAPDRDDFTVATSNKQLNFVQHVLTILKPGGRAAVVAARQLPVRRPGRRGLRDPHARTATCTPSCGCRAARSRPTARASRPTSSSSPRATPTETRLDLRRPHQRPRHHQEGPAAHAGALRRVREVLRRRPERPGQAQAEPTRKEDRWRSVLASTRSRSATSSSTASSGSKTNRSTTPTTCPNPRTGHRRHRGTRKRRRGAEHRNHAPREWERSRSIAAKPAQRRHEHHQANHNPMARMFRSDAESDLPDGWEVVQAELIH